MADFRKFCEKWAANVKPLTAKDGMPEWEEFVKKCQDESALWASVERLGEVAEAKRAGGFPAGLTLRSLKDEYFKRLNAGRSDYQSTDCPYCAGRGFAPAVMDGTSQRQRFINPGRIEECFAAAATYAPCICARGRQWHKEESARQSEQPQDQPRNWQDFIFRGRFSTFRWVREFEDGWKDAERFADKCRKLANSKAPVKQEPRETRKPYLEPDYLETAAEEAGNMPEIEIEANAV